jgi:hypothetical protein
LHLGPPMAPAAFQPTRVVGAFYGNQMGLVVIIVVALMILGVAALGSFWRNREQPVAGAIRLDRDAVEIPAQHRIAAVAKLAAD